MYNLVICGFSRDHHTALERNLDGIHLGGSIVFTLVIALVGAIWAWQDRNELDCSKDANHGK